MWNTFHIFFCSYCLVTRLGHRLIQNDIYFEARFVWININSDILPYAQRIPQSTVICWWMDLVIYWLCRRNYSLLKLRVDKPEFNSLETFTGFSGIIYATHYILFSTLTYNTYTIFLYRDCQLIFTYDLLVGGKL